MMVVDGVRHVEVEVDVLLPVDAGAERGRRVVAERGVVTVSKMNWSTSLEPMLTLASQVRPLLAKPRSVRPAGRRVAGVASRKAPVRNSRAPPSLAPSSWKFMTPAMASEPYWAAAPSRSTSACRMAIEGMTEMSGPCEPSPMPLPSQVMTAARWRRLPLTRISVWSGARLRRFAGRTMVAASPHGHRRGSTAGPRRSDPRQPRRRFPRRAGGGEIGAEIPCSRSPPRFSGIYA